MANGIAALDGHVKTTINTSVLNVIWLPSRTLNNLKILLWNLKHVTATRNAISWTQAFVYPPVITVLCDSWIDHFARMRATENYAVM